MSHAGRVAINKRRNLETRPDDAVFVRIAKRKYAGDSQPQNMWVWPGLLMVGQGHKVLKGTFLTIKSCDKETIVLADDTVLTHDQAAASLRLANALTYASSQGLTLKGRVRLEISSPHFTIKHLYVGASRATSSTLLECVE